MERIVKGIWIPIEIWQDRSLSWNEKILLMEIDSFTSRGHECYISNEYVESTISFRAEWNDCSGQGGAFVPHTDNNEYINNNSLYKKGSSHFQKPSLEAIREYCSSRGNNVDAEQFFNFYESKGWVVGKSPMKDWKAAIRTWEKREKEVPQRKRATHKESVLEHNLKVMDQMFGTNMHEQAYGKKEVYDEQ